MHRRDRAGPDGDTRDGGAESVDSMVDAHTVEWAARVLWPDPRVRTATARSGGAAATETYGILPGRDRARYLVPLRPAAVAAAAVHLRQPLSRLAAVKRSVLGFGLRSGLARPLITDRLHVELPAGAARAERAELDLTHRLRELLGRADVRCSIALGTPGWRRTPVLQATAPGGRVLAYAKVAWSDATRATTAREARNLEALGSAEPLRGRMPRLLDAVAWRDRRVIVQTAPRRSRPGRNRVGDEHLEFLEALAAASPRTAPLVDSPFWERLLERRETAVRAADPADPADVALLDRALGRLADAARGVRLTLGWRHGDFLPWNTKRTGAGLFVVDWERAREGEPTALDLYHFLARSARLIDGAVPGRVYRSLAAGDGRRWMLRYLDRIGAPASHAGLLLLAYLADTFSEALARAPGWTDTTADRRRGEVAEMLTAALAGTGPPGPAGGGR